MLLIVQFTLQLGKIMNVVLNKTSQTAILREVEIVGNFSYCIQVNSIFRCNNWLSLNQTTWSNRKYTVLVKAECCSTPSSELPCGRHLSKIMCNVVATGKTNPGHTCSILRVGTTWKWKIAKRKHHPLKGAVQDNASSLEAVKNRFIRRTNKLQFKQQANKTERSTLKKGQTKKTNPNWWR